ncbi:MAG: DEAD/DEAH box helicase [Segetibacter sp.]
MHLQTERTKNRAVKLFLQSLFRKESFREGQVEILSKALEKKNPIALLPTGAGKSLTYQIASLLQPGLTIVVDPIKALMKDQNENLQNASIDGTVYINSSLSAAQKKENIKKYSEGEFLFAFVSP